MLALSPGALKALRPHMQMIFQDPYASLDPRQTIGQAIAEPMLVHGIAGRSEARDRVAAALTRVGLEPGMARRYPHEFSGGQRQRIAIARALALGPRLIVADEAVSALDVSVKAHILNLLMDLQAELGLAYLFISHDMAVVEHISHRIAVMYMGEIVEIGPRHAIIENPQHSYTQRLLSAVPVPDPGRKGRASPVGRRRVAKLHPCAELSAAHARLAHDRGRPFRAGDGMTANPSTVLYRDLKATPPMIVRGDRRGRDARSRPHAAGGRQPYPHDDAGRSAV